MPIKHLREVTSKPSRHEESVKKGWKPIILTILAISGGVALVGFFILTLMLAWMSRDLPDPNTLPDRQVAQSTKIYDRTGETLLYEIHGDEQRTLVKIEDLPSYIKYATISMEDKNFYSHHGVSWRSLIRAFFVGVFTGNRIQGTSTLTQQFVKNAILTNERSITRKLKELLLSLQIERKYTKDQILQLYLNEIPYGSTMYGVESAAQGFFGKSAKDLTLDEAVLLASIPQSPDRWNPYGEGLRGDNREGLVGRQHYILDLMVEQGYITKEEAEAAKTVDTLSKLIPRQIGNIKAPHFVMMVRAELVEKYGQRTVESGGLKVITTLDWKMQEAAEKAVKEGVEARGEKYGFTNASLVAVDPRNGNILAMVGSKDFFDETIDGQVNVSLRPRQPGSSFKPIVYAKGFEEGYLPQTVLWDVETDFKTDTGNYHPHNYNMGEIGPVSVRKALQGSLNIPAVKMLYLAGVENVLNFAEKLGYTTFGDRSRFGLALVLGGGDVKLLEHVGAYGAFANDGVLQPSADILRIESPDGSVLEEWKQTNGSRVMESQIARLTSDVLSDNGSRAYVFGAANSLVLAGRSVAAKTGTTNDYVDAWTVGYTPSLATGVWVGNSRGGEEGKMKRGADGSIIAAPIWKAFMTEALKDTPVESFKKPNGATTSKSAILGTAFEAKMKIDKVTGKLATEYTPAENIEEKTFAQAHSILQYVDRFNPLGAEPANPQNDPQYVNWEKGVATWVEKSQWNTTSTPPTEWDDVHTKENQPTVSISSPYENERITERSLNIIVQASAQRGIDSIRALVDGYIVGMTSTHNENGGYTVSALLPNALEKGFHDLVVEALDDVGNKGTAKISMNLLANSEPLNIQILDPQPGSEISLDQFPKEVHIQLSDITNLRRVDLYLDAPSDHNRLIGSDIKPKDNPVLLNWSYVQGPGNYYLYAEATDNDGKKIRSDKMVIRVTPSQKTEEEVD